MPFEHKGQSTSRWSTRKPRQEMSETGTVFPCRGNSFLAQSFPVQYFLKAQSVFPLFSSNILGNFIKPTDCRITKTYNLHHEYRRASTWRLRASWKGQEATQAGD